MLHSQFTKDIHSKKKRSKLKPILTIIIFIGIGFGAYFTIENYDRILYKFKKDKYVSLLDTISTLEKLPANSPDTLEKFNEPLKLIETLIGDNPGDSFLYYLKGKITWLKIEIVFESNKDEIRDIVFQERVGIESSPASLDRELWSESIVSIRKALRLGIPKEVEKDSRRILAWLYFLGGSGYWESAGRPDTLVLLQGTNIANLYKIAFSSGRPDWNLVENFLNKDSADLWKSIFFLNTGNVPGGFKTLKGLLLSENLPVRNRAAYLLGKLKEKQKNWRMKYYYHNMIDFDTFLLSNDWFFEEHYYTLRFLGKKTEAKTFLNKYEIIVNTVRSKSS
ncbi:MAG: hypothetical protein ABUK01_18665 [Leptospirales bacterium]